MSIDSCWRPLLALTALLSIAACDTPSDAGGADDLAAVALEGTNVLVFEDGGRLDAVREAIARVVRDAVSRVRGLMPVTGVTIRVSAGTSYVIPEIGIGGRTHGPFDIQIVLDPGSAVLTQSIETELFPLLGHEMHHAMRFRTVGYGDNLLESMVSEGLADQFAVEVAGIDPPLWSKALSGADLVLWSARAREQWFDQGYDYEAWFFGTREIPRWAGYSIGFDLTGRFLRADPARRASGLVGEPAESFIPPDS
jgi:uncharacterized protein YjaZ